MYTVDSGGPAREQIDALPAGALARFAEVRVLLETAPWSGRSLHPGNPDGAVRLQPFGDYGQVVYLILEDQRRVDLLVVQWFG